MTTITRKFAEQYGVSPQFIRRRMAKLNVDAVTAATLPPNRPYWMLRIELDEGQPVEDILRGAAQAAAVTGYGLRQHADEWGVPYSTLQYWCENWGIVWPRMSRCIPGEPGVSRTQLIG